VPAQQSAAAGHHDHVVTIMTGCRRAPGRARHR
jgi:hypothetical protein